MTYLCDVEEVEAKLSAMRVLGIKQSEYLQSHHRLMRKYKNSNILIELAYARKYARWCLEAINDQIGDCYA